MGGLIWSMLKVKNVHKAFGGLKALDGCTLHVKKGSITAIIGPNGSGKSTLFDVISGILTHDSGSIILDGKEISKTVDYNRAKLGIARTFQDVRLFKNLTILDHMEIAHGKTDELLLKSLFQTEHQKKDEIKEILALVGLDKPLNTCSHDLSYGQRKLLDLAVAIAKPHTILMLDEPVAGVNPHLRKEIKKIIIKLNKQGETIVLIEHDMNFVMDLTEYVYVMDYGKVIAEGVPKVIQNNKRVLDAYLGE